MSGLAMVRARRQQQCCSLLVPVCQLAAVGHHASMQSPPSRARASQIEMSWVSWTEVEVVLTSVEVVLTSETESNQEMKTEKS